MGRLSARGVLMESSFLFKAKNALHNAAAKAERILTEIKEDLKTDFGRSVPTIARSNESTEDWSVNYETEQQFQEKLFECILNISKDPDKKYVLWCKNDGDASIETQETRVVFEDDKDLQNLRFNYVPKRMKEHEFWRYCLMAVDRVKKQRVLQEVASMDTDCNPDQDKADFESPKKDPAEEDAYKKAMSLVVIPSSKLLRRYAAAIEVARPLDKMKDLMLLKSEKESSQSGALVLGMKAMKNSLLRESNHYKPSKLEEVQACLQSMFEPDTQDVGACHTKLLEDIHGAPPGSFVSHLAEVMGSLRTHQMMAELWCKLISELRSCWEEGRPIPRLTVDAEPDLRYCLILQKLQVINCCIARQKRHAADLSLLDALNKCAERIEFQSMPDVDSFILLLRSLMPDIQEPTLQPARLFAKGKEGQLLLRLGADFPATNLRMLETGQQVYSPIMQEGPVLTEDLIEETEELVLRTGSMGAGCSQLLSDMQAFQAANPGCILEDFVRWYSPLDWKQITTLDSSAGELAEHETESRGCLSARMQCHGNLWKELWASAKPIPAARQAPLFDEDLAIESTLDALENIAPVELFEQLFKAILGTGFAIAEMSPVMKGELWLSQFLECKNYIVSTCKKGMTAEQIEQLCQVYEMLEILLQYPLEDLEDTKASSSTKDGDGAGINPILAEKGIRYCTNLITIDYTMPGHSTKEQQSCTNVKSEQGFNLFTRILEAKSSLFERKQSQGHSGSEDEKRSALPADGEWTVV